MVPRNLLFSRIKEALERSRIVALVGPRQSGKSTLAGLFLATNELNYFDLEDPVSLSRLTEPFTALRDLKGLVVIDEIQRQPELFPILRVLSDRQPLPAKFLILGSASPSLIRKASDSLAGRLEMIQVTPFSLEELGQNAISQHWLRGGFPLSYLAKSDENSMIWRKNFILSFLERDLPQWGIQVPSNTLLRFWTLLAHYHGQIWNSAEAARAFGVSNVTVRRYLDILEGVFMIRVVQPWHANIKKRQVKSPKIYFRDTGLLHSLLGLGTELELYSHPRVGASWEGYAAEEVIKAMNPDQIYFWATHNGAEIDILVMKNGVRIGIECKRTDAPRMTKSMHSALDDLDLQKLIILYPGDKFYRLGERVQVLPLMNLALLNESDSFS